MIWKKNLELPLLTCCSSVVSFFVNEQFSFFSYLANSLQTVSCRHTHTQTCIHFNEVNEADSISTEIEEICLFIKYVFSTYTREKTRKILYSDLNKVHVSFGYFILSSHIIPLFFIRGLSIAMDPEIYNIHTKIPGNLQCKIINKTFLFS